MQVRVISTFIDSTFVRVAALGLVYWLTVVLAIELVSPADKIALFWPPNAFAAAALIFSSRKHWPLYLITMALAYFAARVPAGHLPLYVYFGFCAANITEVLIVAGLVKRLVRAPITHETLTKVLMVAMLASVPASMVSALIGGIFVTWGVEKATLVNASVGWFTGDLSGLLLVLPALLTWLTPGASLIKSYNKGEIIERTVIASTFVVIGFLTPVYLAKESQISLIFPYVVFPALIWTAMRLGIRSTTVATLAVGLFAIALTYLGQGPFSFEGLSAFGQVVSMKIGLIAIALTTILLATVVTDRTRAEKSQKESEDLLNSIFENVPVGLLIKDPDHIVERANSTYLNWYGFDADTMSSRRSDEIEDFQSPEEAEFMNAQERKVLTTGITLARQVDRPFADGQIHTINITKFPVYDQQGNITKVGSVSVDLTDQVQANRAKSEFIATMSHEFRTPLNAIRGFSEMLRAQNFGPLGDIRYKGYADAIRDSGEHILELVNDILDISAIEMGKRTFVKTAIDVRRLLEGCVKDTESVFDDKNIDVSVDISEGMPLLLADERSLVQIFLNLLSNAIKFTGPKGTISVSAKAANGKMSISVSDSGVGIPPDALPTITEPFTQADSDPHIAREGTGLGLSIVKSLVDEHDGTLKIESEVNVGTTVTVEFPIGSA